MRLDDEILIEDDPTTGVANENEIPKFFFGRDATHPFIKECGGENGNENSEGEGREEGANGSEEGVENELGDGFVVFAGREKVEKDG